MKRFILKLRDSIARRWRHMAFILAGGDGKVLRLGKLWMNVPLRCDGLGQVVLGPHVSIGYPTAPILGDGMVRLQARSAQSIIEIGADTAFSNNVQVVAVARITIGPRCLIGDGVLIMDSDAHELSAEGRHAKPALAAPVLIEENVLIGSRVIILKGVTIGRDSVIGAGSVVARSIPPGVIAAGNPAKVIRPL